MYNLLFFCKIASGIFNVPLVENPMKIDQIVPKTNWKKFKFSIYLPASHFQFLTHLFNCIIQFPDKANLYSPVRED